MTVGDAGGIGVRVRGLHKAFGAREVLRGLELRVPAGRVTAILAPSGSGKTTLLRLVAGFERADRGTITVGETIVSGPAVHLSPASRRVGYVPQEGALFPHLDVAANVGFGLTRNGDRRRGSRDRRARRVAELLALVGLSDLAGRFPHQLSGGEQQRVALARALAATPSLLLLDEPFSSLDASLRTSLRADLTRILADTATTTIMVTHDQDEALSMASQVAVLRDGVVAQAGTPREIYGHPVDSGVASFVGAANLLPGTLRAGRAQTPLGSLELSERAGVHALAEGAELVVLVRPEQIQIETTFGSAADDAAGVVGSVQACDYHGHEAVLTVAARIAALHEPLSVRSANASLAPGASVALHVAGPVMAWSAHPG